MQRIGICLSRQKLYQNQYYMIRGVGCLESCLQVQQGVSTKFTNKKKSFSCDKTCNGPIIAINSTKCSLAALVCISILCYRLWGDCFICIGNLEEAFV